MSGLDDDGRGRVATMRWTEERGSEVSWWWLVDGEHGEEEGVKCWRRGGEGDVRDDEDGMAGSEKRGRGGIWGDPAPSPVLVINPSAPVFRRSSNPPPLLSKRVPIGHRRKLSLDGRSVPVADDSHLYAGVRGASSPCRPVRRLEACPRQAEPGQQLATAAGIVRAYDPPLPPSVLPRATRPA